MAVVLCVAVCAHYDMMLLDPNVSHALMYRAHKQMCDALSTQLAQWHL